MSNICQNKHLLVDAGATKSTFVLLGGEASFRCQCAGINANYTPEADILRILAEAVSQFPKGATINAIDYYGAGCATPQNAFRMEDYLRMYFPTADIRVWSDLMAACHALAGGREAIVCILGTGAASCHYDGHEMVGRAPSLGWLLGDEGSGTHLGKCLVTAYLSETLPHPIRTAFEERYHLNRDLILHKLYQEPKPNLFLSQFAPFLNEFREEPAIRELIINAFETFFAKQKNYYPNCDNLPWHFTGSVAAHFETMLREAAETAGCKIGEIAGDPMERIVQLEISNL
ncbi:MAG: ATPase [Bacteroidales bacterium]|nr:ATPase [Bacteroidales bacterium]